MNIEKTWKIIVGNKTGTGATLLLVLITVVLQLACKNPSEDNRFISYIVNPKDMQLFYKDEQGKNFGSIQRLKTRLDTKGERLDFAMNAGMYKPDGSPQGLYIENFKILSKLDTTKASGNFYLQPNGVFYIMADGRANVSATENFKQASTIKYATQSGPMLVIDGKLHPAFKEGSPNVQVRNGVGILPDGKVLLIMSKDKINFYDFAQYFQSKGCKNALYLDGFVSRTYHPGQNWKQTDGNFAVIIGVATKV